MFKSNLLLCKPWNGNFRKKLVQLAYRQKFCKKEFGHDWSQLGNLLAIVCHGKNNASVISISLSNDLSNRRPSLQSSSADSDIRLAGFSRDLKSKTSHLYIMLILYSWENQQLSGKSGSRKTNAPVFPLISLAKEIRC